MACSPLRAMGSMIEPHASWVRGLARAVGVNPSAIQVKARLRGLFPTNRHPRRSAFYSGVRDLRGLDWGTAMPRRSGAVRARHAVPRPATGSGRLAQHGRPRLFQTKLINIRAHPLHPCRSVFYSAIHTPLQRETGTATAVQRAQRNTQRHTMRRFSVLSSQFLVLSSQFLVLGS